MKALAALLILFAPIARGSLLALITVKQPLYLAGSGGGEEILIRDVQVVSERAGLEVDLGAIVIPFTPPSDGSWRQPGNVNIASLAGIKIRAKESGSDEIEVVVDAASAKVPPNVTFTIDAVIEATVRCVREVARTHGRKVKISVNRPTNSIGKSGPRD